MNRYTEYRDRTQAKVDAFLKKYAFFAFSDGQFVEGMKSLNLRPKDTDKIARLGFSGGYVLKGHVKEWIDLINANADERQTLINDPETGREFARDMFLTELANHEYSYTGSAFETLEALGYTWQEVQQDPILKPALDEAMKAAMSED